MKKIGLLAVAIVLSLGLVGAGFAYWNETLTIEGVADTGEVDVGFSGAKSNDEGTEKDPVLYGGPWNIPDLKNPGGWSWANRCDKNVGKTTCALTRTATDPDNNGDDLMTITVENGYPCYYANVFFTIGNLGTIPVKIESLLLKSISKDGNSKTVNFTLYKGKWFRIDFEAGTVRDYLTAATDDFTLYVSNLVVGQVIQPGDVIAADIGIHVLQAAEEDVIYDFTIEIVATQFNAP